MVEMRCSCLAQLSLLISDMDLQQEGMQQNSEHARRVCWKLLRVIILASQQQQEEALLLLAQASSQPKRTTRQSRRRASKRVRGYSNGSVRM